MDFLLASVLFATGLLVSLLTGVSIIVPLAFGFFCFAGTALHRGHSVSEVARMTLRGMAKPLIVLRILFLIGLLTAVWRASGTVSFCVYYGIKFIEPRLFVLCAFVLSCLVSYALGTCFGTAGTIGVVLMVLARSGGADTIVTAGAAISGAFFGDRCAPTSSSANLVATVTGTHLYANIRNMFRTAFLPTLLTLAIYLVLSLRHPLHNTDTAILSEIASMFDLSLWTALPALLVLLLPPFGADVKLAIVLSILSGAGIALGVQHIAVADILKFLVTGYRSDAPGRFAQIVAGGGLLSMFRVMGIVTIASTYSGIFEGAGLLSGIQSFLERAARRLNLFPTALVTSVVTNMLSCNQTLGVILMHQLMDKIYERRGISRSAFAIHLEDTVILTAGLVPWSVAVATPLAMLAVDARAIPWAVFLWLVPLVNLFPKLRAGIREE